MADLLGLGLTHYPPLGGLDEDMAGILRRTLEDPDVPALYKDPVNWPELMRKEWADDFGVSGAKQHREGVLRGVRHLRAALDEFDPDLVIVFGDDQYENFNEDIIPPYCILAYEDMELYPWRNYEASAMLGGKPNIWNESEDTTRLVRGHREAGRYLATQMISSGFDVSYAYKPLHMQGLSHAFLNVILYLDYDRKGFDYPVLPVPINCYGPYVIAHQGFMSPLAGSDKPLDPPAPLPSRCYEFGANVARIFMESDYRVAIVASSSWSHAFLTDKTYRVQPDNAFDRALYERLQAQDFSYFKNLTAEELVSTGNPEMLNWCAMLGAMEYAGKSLQYSDFVETYVYNSNKVAALFG